MGCVMQPPDDRSRLDDVHRELLEIKRRNARVEREKAWETSWTRRLVIAIAIWIGVWPWLQNLGVQRAALHALVPAAAYVLSTLSLPIVRRWWLRLRFRDGDHED